MTGEGTQTMWATKSLTTMCCGSGRCVCVCACVRACVRVCVRVCVQYVCVCVVCAMTGAVVVY